MSEKHPSLIVEKNRETKIRSIEETADFSIESLRNLTEQFELMKQKWRELKETELTVSTVADLVSRMDGLEQKLNAFFEAMGLNREVLEKESAILDKIGKLLG